MNGFITLINNQNFECLFIFLVVMIYMMVEKLARRGK